jgi:hypothetical protein
MQIQNVVYVAAESGQHVVHQLGDWVVGFNTHCKILACNKMLEVPWTRIRMIQNYPLASSCEHSNEPLGSINDGEFFYQLSDYQLLKKESASFG